MLTVSAARLQSRIAALARFGALPGGGVTRMCWSPAHEEARTWLLGEIKTAGLTSWVDPAGNVYIADRDNQRIRKLNFGGVVSSQTWLDTGTVGIPSAMESRMQTLVKRGRSKYDARRVVHGLAK